MKIRRPFALALLLAGLFQTASAATGEMGTGTPQFGVYSVPVGVHASVWALSNKIADFPVGCNFLVLYPGTMGMDSYKVAIAIMLTARVTNKKVRFYAHQSQDNGCGVDYVELID